MLKERYEVTSAVRNKYYYSYPVPAGAMDGAGCPVQRQTSVLHKAASPSACTTAPERAAGKGRSGY